VATATHMSATAATVAATAAAMSPDQVPRRSQGERAGQTADDYSESCTHSHLLTGVVSRAAFRWQATQSGFYAKRGLLVQRVSKAFQPWMDCNRRLASRCVQQFQHAAERRKKQSCCRVRSQFAARLSQLRKITSSSKRNRLEQDEQSSLPR
jgi:hypothetical protein